MFIILHNTVLLLYVFVSPNTLTNTELTLVHISRRNSAYTTSTIEEH